MKKIFHLIAPVAFIAVALPGNAGIADTGKAIGNGYTSILPAYMTNDNEPKFVIQDDSEYNTYDRTGKYSFEVLDKDLNSLKKFSTPMFERIPYTYTRSYNMEGPIGISVENEYSSPNAGVNNMEFATRVAESAGFSIREKKNGLYYFYGDNEYNYYEYSIYKNKYPMRYAVFDESVDNPDEMMIWHDVYYTCEGYGPTGVFSEPREETNYAIGNVIYMEISNHESGDVYTNLTQGLFNSDDGYEYLVAHYDMENVDIKNETEIIKGQYAYQTGLDVMGETGNVLMTIKYPDGLKNQSHYSVYANVYNIADKTYFVSYAGNENNERFSIFYEIDRTTNTVKQIGAPKRVSVNPTTPKRGTNVSVNVGENRTGALVEVVSLSGSTVYRQSVSPELSTIEIPTDGFSAGMYIVNVTDGRNTREATKIIIR